MTRTFSRWLCGITALSSAVTTLPVLAADDSTMALEEVVVTALRRSERLQDVAASLTVVTGDQLAASGAQDYTDYLNSVPGVTYADNGYRTSRVIIRGVSDGLVVTDPLTGMYIDEAPVTQGSQPTFDPSLYDVERVEVLKGPQGTLYGAGSMGGTVRVIMNKPKLNEFSGAAEGTFGAISHGGDLYRVDGVLNAPLVDDVAAVRIVASYRDEDGFIDNVHPGRERKDVNSIEKTNVRTQVLLKPQEQTSVTLGFMYQDEDLQGTAFSDHTLPRYQQDRVYSQTGPGETSLSSLTIEHEFANATLTSATNYLDKTSAANIDATMFFRGLVGALTGIPVGVNEGLGIATDVDFSVFSQELRLASSGDSRLRWLVGGFYSDARTTLTQEFDLREAVAVSARYTGSDLFLSEQEEKNRQAAVFGELTYEITDRLSATVGARGFDVRTDTKSIGDGVLNGGRSVTNKDGKSSSATQKYLLDYKFTPDNHMYVQAAQGFRAGGANDVVPTTVCGADLAALGYTSAPGEYEPDKLWSYEIGSKNAFLDRRLTLNASAFFIDWDRIQSSIPLPTCGFSFTANAGKAESKGIEIEAALQPVDGWNIVASVGYTDAKLTEAAPGTAASDGDRLPLAAKLSWNLSSQYQFPIGAALNGFARVEVNRVGDRWSQFESARGSTLMDAYTSTNLRLGVSGGNWSAALYATNVFDEYIVTYVPVLGSGVPYDVIATPRVIGVNARYSF
ncbi:TonB-dependent receptor [Steroidobacter flavus]|uniref:TonB-dependent receptor n=1 Tax=Steroidobacter flavus TaxID=1842136 RepID=A0ABV8SKS9_9GAMM